MMTVGTIKRSRNKEFKHSANNYSMFSLYVDLYLYQGI